MSFESKLRNHLADEEFDLKINNFLNTYCKTAILGNSNKDSKDIDSKDIDSKDINQDRDENEYTLESYHSNKSGLRN